MGDIPVNLVYLLAVREGSMCHRRRSDLVEFQIVCVEIPVGLSTSRKFIFSFS